MNEGLNARLYACTVTHRQPQGRVGGTESYKAWRRSLYRGGLPPLGLLRGASTPRQDIVFGHYILHVGPFNWNWWVSAASSSEKTNIVLWGEQGVLRPRGVMPTNRFLKADQRTLATNIQRSYRVRDTRLRETDTFGHRRVGLVAVAAGIHG